MALSLSIPVIAGLDPAIHVGNRRFGIPQRTDSASLDRRDKPDDDSRAVRSDRMPV